MASTPVPKETAEPEPPEGEPERVSEPVIVSSRSRGASETAEVIASRSVAVAQAALTKVKSGFEEARKGLKKRRADWDRVAATASLSAVQADEPIADLAARLDREAAFWRSFALRTLKPGPAHAIAIGTASLALAGGAILALLGGLRGLLGSGTSSGTLWATAGALAIAGVLALAAATWLHRAAAHAANDALARADEAEKRLQRTAAILALRNADDALYKEALVRLERG